MTSEMRGDGNLQLVILGLDPRIHGCPIQSGATQSELDPRTCHPIRLAMVSKATSTSHMITLRQTRPTTEAR